VRLRERSLPASGSAFSACLGLQPRIGTDSVNSKRPLRAAKPLVALTPRSFTVATSISCGDWVSLDGQVHDSQRIDLNHRYVLHGARAIADGVPLEA
jgi:hypothetical protein